MAQKQTSEVPPAQADFPDAKDILDHAPVGIFKTTPEGRFLYANRAFAEMLGYAAPQDLMNSVQDIAAELLADPKYGLSLSNLLAAEGIVRNFESEHIRKDGTRFWALMNIRTVYAEDGSVSHYQGFVNDDTARKNAEHAQKKCEKQYRLMFLNAPMPYQALDEQGNFLEVNQTFLDVLGYSRDELVGKNFGDFLHPDWKDHFRENFPRFKAVGEVLGVEFEMIKKDGSTILIFLNGKIQHDEHGRFLRTHCIFQDVTKQKQAENDLRVSEERFRLSMDATSDGVWDWDIQTGQVYYSPGYARILGYDSTDIPTHVNSWLDLIHSEDREEAFKRNLDCIENRIESFAVEFRMRSRDGAWKWILGRGRAASRDASGRATRMIGTHQDITERKRAEKEIRRIKTMLERAGSMALFGGWSVDVAEGRLYVSGQAAEIYRVEPGETLTLEEAIERYVPEWREAVGEAFTKCVKEGLPFDMEVEIINKRDNRIWIRKSGEAIRNESGEIIRLEGAMQDITDRVQDKEALVRNNQQLQKALDEKDKFFSIIAHDLKSPLAGFMALTKMLTEEFTTLPLKDLRQMIYELAQATETMFNLLKNLLEWSLMQRGLLTYNPVICLLADPIEHIVELFQTTAGNKNVVLQSELDQNLLVCADMQMLNTIIRNLISNAIKFSMSGGTIFISAVRDKDMAVVTVQDNGVGMDEEHLSNLFILTRKKSLRGTQGELGTGLGLLLCKDFVAKHGGRIWVESQPGKGSTFSFALPLADG
ncbi:PAS domain S-box-containing protein [Desulfonatronum thiosulfatophilum]|uniref:histidine kinase n=1 Tax=Desulfonatronum thiosulfatophilum TaxID=617002 RepID=A0A1G6ALL5_9BACT|nr:PAS domain-containing sensor histidine kinase [Desulfonatronum thiosulfatophilum]SDB09023.1 PAS domain S-box-containing protein [Desulfonatronum thiosulfatophilum]